MDKPELDIDGLNKALEEAGLGTRLITIEFSPEEKLKMQGWREGIEKHGQELWMVYHWIVAAQDGNTHGIYRLGEWLEKYGVPDNTGGAHWPPPWRRPLTSSDT